MSETARQAGRVAYGAVARLIGRTLGALLSLIALREATRYFGPVEWGPITAALAWFSIFAFLGTPGVATLAMREVARPEADVQRAFGRALYATLAASALAGILAAGLAVGVYVQHFETLVMLLILVPGIPLAGLFLTSSSVLAGRGRSDVRAVLDVLSSVFLLVATIYVVRSHLGHRGYVTAYLGYLAASALVAVGVATLLVPVSLRGTWRNLRGELRGSFALGQFDLFAAVYARADSVMLYFIRGSTQVAFYGVAFQVVTFLFVVPSLLSNALLPDYMKASEEQRQFLARRGFDVVITMALPLPVFGVLFARPLILWIAGGAYSGAAVPLAILTGAAAFSFLNGYLFQMAIFSGSEQGLWRIIAIVTVTNLIANAVGVSLAGAKGAAVVMVISEAIGLFLYARLYLKKMPSPLGRRYPLSVVIAWTAFMAVCWLFRTKLHLRVGTGVGILPRAGVLVLVYLVMVTAVAGVARGWSRRQRMASSASR